MDAQAIIPERELIVWGRCLRITGPVQAREEAMKIKLRRPSPAMAVALLALFLAVGGNVVAYGLGRNSVHSRDIAPGAVKASDLGHLKLRKSGPILDLDPIAHDGIYVGAGGRAKCKRGERLITGGSSSRSAKPAPHICGSWMKGRCRPNRPGG